MKIALLILFVTSVYRGCDGVVRLPSPPENTEWYMVSDPRAGYIAAELNSKVDNSVKIAAFVDNRVWLFKCGNVDFTVKSVEESIAAVMGCGRDYTGVGNYVRSEAPPFLLKITYIKRMRGAYRPVQEK